MGRVRGKQLQDARLATGPRHLPRELSELWRTPVPDPEIQEALDEWEDKRVEFQDKGDLAGEAYALLITAKLQAQQRFFEDAMTAVKQAQALYLEAGDRSGQAWTTVFVAELWEELESHERALHHANRAREQMQRLGDKDGEARMLFLVGQTRLRQLEEREDAVETDANRVYEGRDEAGLAARAMADLVDFCRTDMAEDPKRLGTALCMTAQVLVYQQKFQGAIDAVEESLPLFGDGDEERSNKASAYLLGAKVHNIMAALPASLEKAQAALALFRRAEEPEGEKSTLALLKQLRAFDFRVDGDEPSPLDPLTAEQPELTVRAGVLTGSNQNQ